VEPAGRHLVSHRDDRLYAHLSQDVAVSPDGRTVDRSRDHRDTGPTEATDLFLINLPFVNIYLKPHLQEAWANEKDADLAGTAPDLRCHVLTYADNVLRMEETSRLEQIDAHSFSLSCGGRGYFSGALGQFLVKGWGRAHDSGPDRRLLGRSLMFESSAPTSRASRS